MKTRKIRGGLYGNDSKQQLRCVLNSIQDVFYKYITDTDRNYINTNFTENTDKNKYYLNKFFRKKSSVEEQRNFLLFVLLELIDPFVSSPKYSNVYFDQLYKLIVEIIKMNNKGKYYKQINSRFNTSYKSNYQMFHTLFCIVGAQRTFKEEVNNEIDEFEKDGDSVEYPTFVENVEIMGKEKLSNEMDDEIYENSPGTKVSKNLDYYSSKVARGKTKRHKRKTKK